MNTPVHESTFTIAMQALFDQMLRAASAEERHRLRDQMAALIKANYRGEPPRENVVAFDAKAAQLPTGDE